jgi:MFS family permease
MRAVLANRDARLLLAGHSLSSFGDWALLIVLAVWVKTLTGSSAAAGMTFFAFGLGALFGPLGGVIADRTRRRPLMIACDLVLGGGVLLLLLVRDRGDVWLIYVVAVLYGLVGTIFYPARSALLRQMLPEELLADANGALSSLREGLRVIAPLAGAGLYTAAGGGVVAILDAVTFACSAFLLSRLRLVEETPRRGEHRFLAEASAGARHVWRTLPLRRIVLGMTAALLVLGFSETLIFSLIAHLGHAPSFFGVLATLQGAGAIVGGVTAAALLRRIGDCALVGVALALFGACVSVLPWATTAIVLAGFPLAGVGIAWAIVAFNTAVQVRTPLAIQGRVSAAADLSLSLAQTISIATGAALSTVFGYRVLFLAMGVVVLASAAYLLTRRAVSAASTVPASPAEAG